MRRTIEAFEFEHGGRTYMCSAEARAGGKKEMWWWFRVSGDAQRYAPFEVVASESRDAVAKRIVAWHAALLERRSAPAVSPQAWWQRRKQAASGGGGGVAGGEVAGGGVGGGGGGAAAE